MKRGNPVSALLDEALGRIIDQIRISKSHPPEFDAAALAQLLEGDGRWPPAPSLAVRVAETQATELLPLLNRRNRRWRGDYALNSVSVASPVQDAPPNDLIHALHLYRPDCPTAPTMIYVHGWGVRRLQMRLNLGLRWLAPLGMNLLLVEQPYHMQRSPAHSYYSGEFSIGANLPQTVSTVQQSVWDTQVMISWLLGQGVNRVGVAGESLGGLVAALVAQFDPRIAYTIPIMPAVRLDRVFWRARLTRQVRMGLRDQGLTPQMTAQALRTIFPGRYPLAIDRRRVLLIQGRADRVVFPEYTTRLAQRWGAKLVLSGHSHTTALFGISTRRQIQRFLSQI
jgi:acetyl esterase/lipase